MRVKAKMFCHGFVFDFLNMFNHLFIIVPFELLSKSTFTSNSLIEFLSKPKILINIKILIVL